MTVPPRVSVVMLVARLETGEILRDPQVGFLLSGAVALGYVMIFGGTGPQPLGVASALWSVGPLGLLFIAGPRRGAAHEAAFRRLVGTHPLTAAEWFWGRFLGLHSLSLAYALLVMPTFLVVVSLTAAPLVYLVNGLVTFAAWSSLLILVGLALGGTRIKARAHVVMALIALAVLVTARLPGLVSDAGGAVPQQTWWFLLALMPNIVASLAGGLVPAADAPSWALGVALVTSLGATALASWRANDADAPFPVWTPLVMLVGAGVLAFTMGPHGTPPPRLSGGAALARLDIVPVFALLAFVPAGVALARRWLVRG